MLVHQLSPPFTKRQGAFCVSPYTPLGIRILLRLIIVKTSKNKMAENKINKANVVTNWKYSQKVNPLLSKLFERLLNPTNGETKTVSKGEADQL